MNLKIYPLLFAVCGLFCASHLLAENQDFDAGEANSSHLEESFDQLFGRHYAIPAPIAYHGSEDVKEDESRQNNSAPSKTNFFPAIYNLPYAKQTDTPQGGDEDRMPSKEKNESFIESEYVGFSEGNPQNDAQHSLETPVHNRSLHSKDRHNNGLSAPATPVEYESKFSLNPVPAEYYFKPTETHELKNSPPSHLNEGVNGQSVNKDPKGKKNKSPEPSQPINAMPKQQHKPVALNSQTEQKKRNGQSNNSSQEPKQNAGHKNSEQLTLLRPERQVKDKFVQPINEESSETSPEDVEEIAYVGRRGPNRLWRAETTEPCLVDCSKDDLKDICFAGPDCDTSCLPNFCLYTGYMLGKGVGYRTGYTSLGLLTSSLTPSDWKFQPFIDLRGHVLNNGEKAANIGLGARYLIECLDAIVGMNAYYDYRQGRFDNFNQVGIGFEAIGECWDFRINGYIPVGNRDGSKRKVFDQYQGNYIAVCTRRERSLAGFDAEMGYFLKRRNPCATNCCSFDLYGAVGPYYFSTKCGPDAWGGQVRLLATWMKYLNVEVIATSDRVYHERVQGRFGIEIPLGGTFWGDHDAGCCSSVLSCSDSCCWPRGCDCPRVQRREMIVLEEECDWKTNYKKSCDCSSSSSSSSSSWSSDWDSSSSSSSSWNSSFYSFD